MVHRGRGLDRAATEAAGTVQVAGEPGQPALVGPEVAGVGREAAAAVEVQGLRHEVARPRPTGRTPPARRPTRTPPTGAARRRRAPGRAARAPPTAAASAGASPRYHATVLRPSRARTTPSSEWAARARASTRPARSPASVSRSWLASRTASRLAKSASARRSPSSAASRAPVLERAQQLVGAELRADRRVAAAGPQGGELQPPLADAARRRERRVDVLDGGRPAHPRLVDPAADQQGACPRLPRQPGHAEDALHEGAGVLHRRPAQGLLAGEQPAAGGAGVVPDGVRVGGHHLGPVAGQVGGAAVVGGGHRLRQGGVHALLEEVVGELVDRTAADEQAAAGEVLAVARRR